MAARAAPNGVKEGTTFRLVFRCLNHTFFSWKVFHGFQKGQVHSRKHKLSKKYFWKMIKSRVTTRRPQRKTALQNHKLWYDRVFSVESDGEGPRSKFEREDGQTDSGKTGMCEHCDVMVPHWCHLAIMAGSRDWIKIFVISRNQPASSDDMMLTRRWLRSSSRSSSWRSPVSMLWTLTRCHRKFS